MCDSIKEVKNVPPSSGKMKAMHFVWVNYFDAGSEMVDRIYENLSPSFSGQNSPTAGFWAYTPLGPEQS
jgi:hypothetical protein